MGTTRASQASIRRSAGNALAYLAERIGTPPSGGAVALGAAGQAECVEGGGHEFAGEPVELTFELSGANRQVQLVGLRRVVLAFAGAVLVKEGDQVVGEHCQLAGPVGRGLFGQLRLGRSPHIRG